MASYESIQSEYRDERVRKVLEAQARRDADERARKAREQERIRQPSAEELRMERQRDLRSEKYRAAARYIADHLISRSDPGAAPDFQVVHRTTRREGIFGQRTRVDQAVVYEGWVINEWSRTGDWEVKEGWESYSGLVWCKECRSELGKLACN